MLSARSKGRQHHWRKLLVLDLQYITLKMPIAQASFIAVPRCQTNSRVQVYLPDDWHLAQAV